MITPAVPALAPAACPQHWVGAMCPPSPPATGTVSHNGACLVFQEAIGQVPKHFYKLLPHPISPRGVCEATFVSFIEILVHFSLYTDKLEKTELPQVVICPVLRPKMHPMGPSLRERRESLGACSVKGNKAAEGSGAQVLREVAEGAGIDQSAGEEAQG